MLALFQSPPTKYLTLLLLMFHYVHQLVTLPVIQCCVFSAHIQQIYHSFIIKKKLASGNKCTEIELHISIKGHQTRKIVIQLKQRCIMLWAANCSNPVTMSHPLAYYTQASNLIHCSNKSSSSNIRLKLCVLICFNKPLALRSVNVSLESQCLYIKNQCCIVQPSDMRLVRCLKGLLKHLNNLKILEYIGHFYGKLVINY